MGRWDKKPFEEWNAQDWQNWQNETHLLIRKTEMLKARLIQYAALKGWVSLTGE